MTDKVNIGSVGVIGEVRDGAKVTVLTSGTTEGVLLQDIIDTANTAFEEALSKLPYVKADKLGLDYRAGYVHISVEEQLIIVNEVNKRNLEYYGGFEYVDDEARFRFSEWTLYDGDLSSSVAHAINYYIDSDS